MTFGRGNPPKGELNYLEGYLLLLTGPLLASERDLQALPDVEIDRLQRIERQSVSGVRIGKLRPGRLCRAIQVRKRENGWAWMGAKERVLTLLGVVGFCERI